MQSFSLQLLSDLVKAFTFKVSRLRGDAVVLNCYQCCFMIFARLREQIEHLVMCILIFIFLLDREGRVPSFYKFLSQGCHVLTAGCMLCAFLIQVTILVLIDLAHHVHVLNHCGPRFVCVLCVFFGVLLTLLSFRFVLDYLPDLVVLDMANQDQDAWNCSENDLPWLSVRKRRKNLLLALGLVLDEFDG